LFQNERGGKRTICLLAISSHWGLWIESKVKNCSGAILELRDSRIPHPSLWHWQRRRGWQSVALPATGALIQLLVLILAGPAILFRRWTAVRATSSRMWIWLSVLGLAYTFSRFSGLSIGRSNFPWRVYSTGLNSNLMIGSRDKRSSAGRSLAFSTGSGQLSPSALAAFCCGELEGLPDANFCVPQKCALGDGGSASISAWFCAFGGILQAGFFARSIGSMNILTEFFAARWSDYRLLSFQFEYLFGLLIQTFLVLLAFVWIRGLTRSRAGFSSSR
jgi:hypothetical protein